MAVGPYQQRAGPGKVRQEEQVADAATRWGIVKPVAGRHRAQIVMVNGVLRAPLESAVVYQ